MQDWLKSRSLLFSQIFVILFALLLLALDLGCVPIVRWFAALRGMGEPSRRGFLVVILLCSVFGWILLFACGGCWAISAGPRSSPCRTSACCAR